MKRLEKYGHQGHLGGWITSALEGKTIECLMMDGEYLIIRTPCQHEARIGWQCASGNKLFGSPYLENLDVKIQLQGASLTGAAADL